MIPSKETKLWHIDAAIEVKKLYAQYWMAQATTGVCKNRIVCRTRPNGESYRVSDDELVKDTLDIALNQIQGINELIDERLNLMNGE